MAIQRATENTVREAPMTGAKLQAADFGQEAYGRALEGFGKQLGQVVEEADKIVYKYDLAAAKNADTEDAIELARIRAEALNATGIDAETAAETARQEADELKKRRLTSLKGRRAELYSTAFDQRLVSFETQISEHSIKQADVAERGAALSRSETSLNLAVDGYTDPEVYTNNMATAKEEYWAGNRGVPEDQLEAKWKEVTSRAHVSITGLIMNADPMNPDPQKAKDWLDDHKGEILPTHHTEILKSLNPLLKADMVTAEYARSMAQGAILEGGGDYDTTGEIKPPTTETLDRDDTAGIVGATAAPGETPDGLDPKRPLADAAGAKPTAPKAQEPYKNSTELFDAVLGKGNYRVGNAYGSPRPGGKTHGGTDLPARAGTSIHPPMSGTVVARGFDKLPEAGGHGGGFYIRIKHPNGTVTGYAHMGGETPFKVGDQVDRDDIIGVVGSSGRSSGPHLHFTVRDDTGAKVNPQQAAALVVADAGGEGLKDPVKTSWKEGDLVLVNDDKDTLGTALNRINLVAQKEGWSQNKYDLVVGEAKSRSAMNDQLYKQGYDQLVNRVNGKIADIEANGGRLTDVSQLGADYGKLEGNEQRIVSSLARAGKRALETGEDIPTYGEEYTDWRLMSTGSPDEQALFLQQDFRSNPLMPPSEKLYLSERQNEMRRDQTGKQAASVSETMSIVDRYAPDAGFVEKEAKGPTETKANKEDRRRRALLVDRVLTRIQSQQLELGRELTPIEKETIVKSQVIAVHKDGKKMPLYIYQTTPGAKEAPGQLTVDPDKLWPTIPQLVKDSIIKGLVDRGERPTPRAVMNEYIRGL